MESTFKPELWHDLFVMIGSSAGALVGLLFVVMSLHIDKISKRTDYNMRATIDGARANTIRLLTVLVEAAAVLAPQPLPFMGAELIALNIFGLWLPLDFTLKYLNKGITISPEGGFPAGLILTVFANCLLGIAAGVIVFKGLDWGLYVVAASCVLKIIRAVMTAWMLMFGILQARPPK